jgi:hypothetical protein
MLAPDPALMPSPTARPPLRLVRPDERGCPDGCVHPDGHVYRSDDSATRLTRRGRLVSTLMVTVAVAALAVALAASVGAAPPEIDHATTVSAGQTLSEVAATQLPDLPIPDAVARIQLVNGLNSSEVQAGQVLLIPVWP